MNAAALLSSGTLLLAAARWEVQVLFWGIVFVLVVAALQLTSRARISAALCLGILVAALVAAMQLSSPLVTAVMLGALGLLLSVPPSTYERRLTSIVYLTVAAGFVIYEVAAPYVPMPASAWVEWIVLGLLAAVTVAASLAMISSRSAIYAAIWFAVALLGTGGLFLFQGALFLGVATVVVYAGAIVVTLLFVIMLAQPEGHTIYDRISWGWFAKPAAVLAGALLLGTVAASLQRVDVASPRDELLAAVARVNDQRREQGAEPITWRERDIVKVTDQQRGSTTRVGVLLASSEAARNMTAPDRDAVAMELARTRDPASPPQLAVVVDGVLPATRQVRSERHMASFGGYLFSRHLIAVEVAGTLLLAALVGAIAMLAQREPSAPREAAARSPAARQPSPGNHP